VSPLGAAAVWAGAGIAGAVFLPALRLRRLAALVPLLAFVAVLLVSVLPGVTLPTDTSPGAFHMDRTTQGLLMASAVSVVLMLILSPPAAGAEVRTLGIAGAAAVVALTSAHPVVMTLALLTAAAAVALRWIARAPGHTTLAAGRVAIAGGAILVAATAFLPVADVLAGPRPVVASALLAGGLATLLGLLPVGGWALGGMLRLRGVEAAVWPLVVAPAALLVAQRIQLILPPLGVATFGHVILTMGLLTAVWHGFQATRAAPGGRYARVLVADLGLAAAAIGSGHTGLAQAGGLFLITCHLLMAPVLLQPPGQPDQRPRRLAWLLLSGVPPAPSFWGRFLLLEGLSQVSATVLTFTLVPMGLLFVASVLGARGAAAGRVQASDAPPARPARLAAAWAAVAGAVAMGLFSTTAAAFIFGPT